MIITQKKPIEEVMAMVADAKTVAMTSSMGFFCVMIMYNFSFYGR